MSVEVRRATAEDREQWNDLVDRSPHGTPFHKLECLELLSDVTGDECHRFVGYKGEEPVGMFPVFVRRRGPVSLAFSPPPDLRITYLGPALVNQEHLKQRKAERRNQALVKGALDALEETANPSYASIRTHPRYEDPRPFSWDGFRATPYHTYVVSLERSTDDLFAAFTSDVRTNVRNCEEDGLAFETGGPDAIRTLFEHIRASPVPDFLHDVTADFAVDLHERLPEGDVRPYVVRHDGEQVAGALVLESGDMAYKWLGIANPDCERSVTEYLDWNAMRACRDRGVTRFDMVGAGVQRLSRYKSKFAPDVVPHVELERGSLPFRAAAALYTRLR